MNCIGNSGNTSIYTHLELVIGQYILSHDHRKFGTRIEITVRNFARLQNGRSANIVHFANAHKYE